MEELLEAIKKLHEAGYIRDVEELHNWLNWKVNIIHTANMLCSK